MKNHKKPWWAVVIETPQCKCGKMQSHSALKLNIASVHSCVMSQDIAAHRSRTRVIHCWSKMAVHARKHLQMSLLSHEMWLCLTSSRCMHLCSLERKPGVNPVTACTVNTSMLHHSASSWLELRNSYQWVVRYGFWWTHTHTHTPGHILRTNYNSQLVYDQCQITSLQIQYEAWTGIHLLWISGCSFADKQSNFTENLH